MIDSILTGTLLPAVSREILERLRTERPLGKVEIGVAGGEFVYSFD
jgi:type VI secretion system protein VasG